MTSLETTVFDSSVGYVLGEVNFPEYSNTGIMMMPIILDDMSSLPPFLNAWRDLVSQFCEWAQTPGVGYLTIDEAIIPKGRTHRRPGLHVDGVGPSNNLGAWLGTPIGGWGSRAKVGMIQASSVIGCEMWLGEVEGVSKPNGDCAHLQDQLSSCAHVTLQESIAYAMNGYTLHKSIPAPQKTKRQYIRLSMPTNAPWYEGYTHNPTGVLPTGPIEAPRTQFMSYRESLNEL